VVQFAGEKRKAEAILKKTAPPMLKQVTERYDALSCG
jgi:hypothetical protein